MGEAGLWVRVPMEPAFSVAFWEVGCAITLDGFAWRFGAELQLHAYDPAEIQVTCP